MSRENILSKIKKNKPTLVALPPIPDFKDAQINALTQFKKSAEATGIRLISINEEWSSRHLAHFFPKDQKTLDLSLNDSHIPTQVDNIQVLVLKGQLGIAENAAIWLDERDLKKRILPFITQELVIILDKSNIVQNMHEAYQKIKIDDTGFGVFIAGPSKTADIEQSLVIGAQGARKMFVVLI